VPAVVRWLVERRLPQLIMAGSAGDHRMTHAPAACRGLPGWPADTRLPAHLRLTGPELVTERAVFRLVLEQRNRHLNDHAGTSRYASMITAAGSEAGPGGVGPCAAIHAGFADSGGRSQSQHRMGPGYGGPGTRSDLAISLAEQPCASAASSPARRSCSGPVIAASRISSPCQRVIPHAFLLTFPDGFMPITATRPGTGSADMA
jgi:hypothetical protein